MITFILGTVISHIDIPFPRAGPLSELWCSLIEKGIPLGNKVYGESQSGIRDLPPEEAAYVLRSIKNIKLEEPLAVRVFRYP